MGDGLTGDAVSGDDLSAADPSAAADRPLPRAFYDRPVLAVARDLLGTLLVRGGVAVRLTEVEAYGGATDAGSHAFRGRTGRTAVMFGPGGYAYVYFTYGMHWCVNLVCGPAGEASAVLLRAGEVVEGADIVAARRAGVPVRDWARGPARLTRALDIQGPLNGTDVTVWPGALAVLPGTPVLDDLVRRGPRVGLAGAADWPWRFWIDGDRSVSTYRPAVTRRPRETRSPGGPPD